MSRPSVPVARVVPVVVGLAICLAASSPAASAAELTCEADAALASGPPDPTLFSRDASACVRAFWCEQYDASGVATRTGPYRERYANGQLRLRARYNDAKLAGPIEIRHGDGTLFARGFLVDGEWQGALEIFHETGSVSFEASFRSGQLDGPVRTRYPDGALESETRFQTGREDGMARSFHPSQAGGRLKSEVRIEADEFIGLHRLLDRDGNRAPSIDPNQVQPIQSQSLEEPAAPDFDLASESDRSAASTSRVTPSPPSVQSLARPRGTESQRND